MTDFVRYIIWGSALIGFLCWLFIAVTRRWGYAVPALIWLGNLAFFYTARLFLHINPQTLNTWSGLIHLLGVWTLIGLAYGLEKAMRLKHGTR